MKILILVALLLPINTGTHDYIVGTATISPQPMKWAYPAHNPTTMNWFGRPGDILPGIDVDSRLAPDTVYFCGAEVWEGMLVHWDTVKTISSGTWYCNFVGRITYRDGKLMLDYSGMLEWEAIIL